MPAIASTTTSSTVRTKYSANVLSLHALTQSCVKRGAKCLEFSIGVGSNAWAGPDSPGSYLRHQEYRQFGAVMPYPWKDCKPASVLRDWLAQLVGSLLTQSQLLLDALSRLNDTDLVPRSESASSIQALCTLQY